MSDDLHTDAPPTESRGLTRRLTRWLVCRYYPIVAISHQERIPQTGALLLCANHANSLIDPVLVGVAAGRPVRFMAKAPLFDHPVLGIPMRALGMIPAFRGSDDVRAVRRNLESLEAAADVLRAGDAVGIFPEGKSTDAAHLEMVRSGAARMALQALEGGTVGLCLVPLGLNYERKDAARSAVWIAVAEPIDVESLLAEHDGDARRARRALTEIIEGRLKQVVIHLDQPEWEPWLDDVQTLVVAPGNSRSALPVLVRRKRLADAINHFLATDADRARSVAEEISEYRRAVTDAGLVVESPVLRTHGLKVCGELLWTAACVVVLFLPALCGTLHHLVPFVASRWLASRIDQPGRKTIATNRMLVGLPVYAVWYAAVTLWMLSYFSRWVAWSWTLAAPFCGVLALSYWRRIGDASRLLWHQLKVTINRSQLQSLRDREAALRKRLRAMADEFEAVAPAPLETPPVKPRRRLPRGGRRLIAIALIAVVVWLARYALLDAPLAGNGLDLASLPAERLTELMEADQADLLRVAQSLDRLEREGRAIHREFADGNRSFTRQGDNDDVRELLRRYLVHRQALLRLIWRYQRYADVSDEALRMRAFLIDFASAAVLYDAGLRFVDMYSGSRDAREKLNEPEAAWGIPPGVYDSVRRNLASPKNMRMFQVARDCYHEPRIQSLFRKHQLTDGAPWSQIHGEIATAEATITRLGESVPERILETAVGDLGKLLTGVQYEMQSAISTWIGDVKIRQPRDGRPLINSTQLERLRGMLEPGDILLERRNWYLSNAFLPGYWPHGAVYVGSADDLRELEVDTDPQVARRWSEFTATDDHGHEHVIIEAVSEGVVFSSLEHSVGEADSVAVLRPRVSDAEKKEAIAAAFRFVGRPYDFEFDFETTDTLVCTEVVYRSYGGNSKKIQFPLERIMGRQTMPAINLVRKFDREFGRPEPDFKFIAFIEGDERSGASRFVNDVDAFRATADRPASSFFQTPDYAVRSIGPIGWFLVGATGVAAIIMLLRPDLWRTRPRPDPQSS